MTPNNLLHGILDWINLKNQMFIIFPWEQVDCCEDTTVTPYSERSTCAVDFEDGLRLQLDVCWQCRKYCLESVSMTQSWNGILVGQETGSLKLTCTIPRLKCIFSMKIYFNYYYNGWILKLQFSWYFGCKENGAISIAVCCYIIV